MDPTQLPLRDIHLPAPPGWWPPATGWWLLMAITALLITFATWFWRRRKRPPVHKIALRVLGKMETSEKSNPRDQAREISALMRRVCISAFPRRDVAGLTGEAWLRFLDEQMGEQRFTEGAGRILLEAPYRPDADVDIDSLVEVCRDWLNKLPRVRK